MDLKNKIRGMFLGVAIGDALGMPFESKPYDVVKKVKKREKGSFVTIYEEYLSNFRYPGTRQ